MKTNGRIPLVYLLAASHSGSTLLAMLLNAHPLICTVGELKVNSIGQVDSYRCSCRRLIRECPFWTGIRSDMAARGFDFEWGRSGTDLMAGADVYVSRLLRPLHRGPIGERLRDIALALSPKWRYRLRVFWETNYALLDCLRHRTGKSIIVDSSKIGIRLKYLLRDDRLDIKVLRLIRDGRGVAMTYLDPGRFADAKDSSLRCGGRGGDRPAEAASLADAARQWRRSNEEAEAILKGLRPNQHMQIRYEELCASPRLVLGRIFQWLDVPDSLWNEKFREAEHHVVGNGMRLDSSSEILLDERWRETMTEVDLRVFNSEAGLLCKKYGYT